jgi:alkylation response protein AidB-like acyl-CoA dehydrogenase
MKPESDLDFRADLLEELDKHAQTAFAPRERAYHANVSMPYENLKELHQRGLLTATVTSYMGGLGSNVMSDDPVTFIQALRIVARVSPGTAHCMQVQNHVAWAIDEIGTETQRQRFIAPMVKEMRLGSFVGSEAKRTHMYSLNTTARRVDGGYVVTGQKNYASNGYEDGLAVIFASIEGETERTRAHLMVIVEPGMEGLSINHEWYRPSGMRVCPSPEITLDQVFVDDDHVLGAPGEYLTGRWQGRFHLGFAANYLGTIEGAYRWVLQVIRERGKGKDPFVQLRIGECQTRLYGAAMAFERALEQWRLGDVQAAELASIKAKALCAEAAKDVSHTLVALAGSTALFDEFPLGRLLRDLGTHILHVGHDKSSQIIGQAELGEIFDSTLQR